jgi:hypothetical protein
MITIFNTNNMKKKLIFVYLVVNISLTNAQFLKDEFIPLKKPDYQTVYISRNDTIFAIRFFPNIENYDSYSCQIYAFKFNKNMWKTDSISDGTYSIIKFKKLIKSQWLKNNNGKLFVADYECRIQRYWRYESNGEITTYFRVGRFACIKRTNKDRCKYFFK